jgi:hypothetical protein
VKRDSGGAPLIKSLNTLLGAPEYSKNIQGLWRFFIYDRFLMDIDVHIQEEK